MLELDGLSRRYGDVVALDDLSFAVSPGQMFGFVGTNGAGKTTAMRIVVGVLQADAGQVRWHGRPLDADIRREIGYMPEERGLYPKMRVHEQLIYLAELRGIERSRARSTSLELLEALGLAERASDRVEELSLGNQQRVQLAAALVHDPSILVLDEPFSGLDPMGVDSMAAVLRDRVDAGAALVFSSHQLDLVERLCDAVGIIRSGRLVASGTVAELRAGGSGRFRLTVDAGSGWSDALAANVPGLAVLDDASTSSSAVVVEIGDGDDQQLLDAARALGPVREFTPVHPSLADLFRNVVSEEGTHPAPADRTGTVPVEVDA